MFFFVCAACIYICRRVYTYLALQLYKYLFGSIWRHPTHLGLELNYIHTNHNNHHHHLRFLRAQRMVYYLRRGHKIPRLYDMLCVVVVCEDYIIYVCTRKIAIQCKTNWFGMFAFLFCSFFVWFFGSGVAVLRCTNHLSFIDF